MSRRDPFLYAFESSYGVQDAMRAFSEILNGVFTTPDGYAVITALEQGDELPLTSGLFIRQRKDNELELLVGSKAEINWRSRIRFMDEPNGTSGDVVLDRPKKDMTAFPAAKRHDEYLRFKHDMPRELFTRGGFRITRQDTS